MSSDSTKAYPCPVEGCQSTGFTERKNLIQHIRKMHGGKAKGASERVEELGLTECPICEEVFVNSRYDAHIRTTHGDDAEDFRGSEDSNPDENRDTPSDETAGDEFQPQGAGEDEESRDYEFWLNHLFFGRLRPVRAAKGEEAIVFAKMADEILKAIFLAIQAGDEEAEKWSTLAFNLCPKLLGCGNKGDRIKLMSDQIEKSSNDDDQEIEPLFRGIAHFFDHTLPACNALAALAKNKKPSNPNGYFSSSVQSRKARRRLQQNAVHKANKNRGKAPGNHVLTAENTTGEISLPVAKKMQRLMRHNMLSKAVMVLEDHITHKTSVLQSDEITDDVKEQLEALHPHEDPLEEILADEEYPCAEISVDEVMGALMSAARESAVAFSPWTYELLLTACKVHERFLCGLTELLQHMMCGTLGSKDIWLAARLIPLMKPNGKIRPIAIGEVFYRLVGRVANRQAKEKAEVLLAPVQLGIAVSDGIGIAIHSLKGMVEESLREGSDKVLVCLDIKAAYNNIHRAAILETLRQDMPELVRLFMWAYADHTELRDSTGKVMCMSKTGVKQGDAGGGLFFDTTYTINVLQKVVDAEKEATVLGVHDDSYLWASIEVAIRALKLLEELAQNIGLTFNREKCVVVRNAQNANADSLLGMPGTSNGIVALGVPIGTPSFVEEKAREMFTMYGNVLNCIADLPPGMAIPVLSGCTNGKPTHLLRAIEPALVRGITVEWDKKMDAAIAKICMATICEGGYDDFSEQVRGLTTSRGGLGIKRLHILSYDAYLASFWRACGYAKKHMPRIWEICINSQDGESSAEEKIDSLLEYYELPPGLGVRREFYFENELSALKQSVLTIVSQDAILAALLKDKNFSKARKAMLISAGSHGTASFVYFETQSNPQLYLPSEVYREAIRLRLTLPGIESDPGFRQDCPCAIGDMEDTALHGLLCNATSGARKIRHDRIVQALAHYITWCNPAAKIEVEVWLDDNTKADIRMTLNGKITWIDVSIVAPIGVRYIAMGSDKKSLVAAKDREEVKRRHYAPAIMASVGAVTFIPFVLEITGALGSTARKFVDDVAHITTALPEANEDMARKRRYFKKLYSAYLAIGNEHCLRVSRRKMHAVRRQLANTSAPEEPPPEDLPPGGNLAMILYNGSNNLHPLPPDPGRETAGEQGGIPATTILHNRGNTPSPELGREAASNGGTLATMPLDAASASPHPLDIGLNAIVGGDELGQAVQVSSTILDIEVVAIEVPDTSSALSLNFGQGGDNANDN